MIGLQTHTAATFSNFNIILICVGKVNVGKMDMSQGMVMILDVIFIIIGMSKYYEVLVMGHLVIQIDDIREAQCDLNRIKMKVYEYGTPSPSASSRFYAEQKENKLEWDEPLELRFTGQKKLAFQVYCQGDLQQNGPVELLYRAVYHINNEKPSKKDSCHIYSTQGEKKGLLRLEVKKIMKEQLYIVEEKIEDVKPLFPQNLIGVIRICEASLEISNPIFNKKKHPFPVLTLTFGRESWTNEEGNDYRWLFQDIKIQYTTNSSQIIALQLSHDGISLLNGKIHCEGIRKLKRYMKHSVSMFNKNQIKVGNITLQLRYMDKEQLIGFVYSPQNNPNFTKRYPPQKITNKIMIPVQSVDIIKKNQSFINESRAKLNSNRYNKLTNMHTSAVLQPKTARFSSKEPTNPYISYLDPQKLSDFSPKRKKGWDMSLGRKFDFTRQYRGNPGVGTYKLPSIWDQ